LAWFLLTADCREWPHNFDPKLMSVLKNPVSPSDYVNLSSILKFFLVLLLMPLASSAQPRMEPSQEQLAWLGQQIFRNECNSNPACMTAWNEGEAFPSLGIGHFIWYRKGQREIFTESFPDLLAFMQNRGIQVPDWIVLANYEQPWATREEFLAAQQDERMVELRRFLAAHIESQTAFIVSRFDRALENLLAQLPAAEQPALSSRFTAVALAHPPYGLYALIDYIHFKGEGSNPAERYNGQGWGLLQVLQGMPVDASAPLDEFVFSARNMLARRVANAPPERREQRWLDGWNNRLATYLPAQERTAVQE
jgi:hypothetical protein